MALTLAQEIELTEDYNSAIDAINKMNDQDDDMVRDEYIETQHDMAMRLIEMKMEMTTLEIEYKKLSEKMMERMFDDKIDVWGITISKMNGRVEWSEKKGIDYETVPKDLIVKSIDKKKLPKDEYPKYFDKKVGKPFIKIDWLPKAV